jgi:hypothetical protein
VVSGEAPAGTNLEINLYVDGQPEMQTVLTATASGTYSATFPVPAEANYIRGYLTHFTSEDTTTLLEFSTTFWSVFLGSSQVAGRVSMSGPPVDITLRSADGTFQQTVTFTATMYGGNFAVDFERAVHPGDQLTMETVDGLVNTLTVPDLSAAFDYTRRVLEGRAPLDGELIAHIPIYSGSAHRRIRVASTGRYGVDASDLILMVGGQGNVRYTDRFGNKVTCPFIIRGYPSFLPLIRLLATAP